MSPLAFVVDDPLSDINVTRATSRERNTLVEGDVDHASLNANDVTSTSDKSAECSIRNEQQVIEECKATLPKCEGQRSLARLDSNSASEECTAVVISPQVSVDEQQTITVVSETRWVYSVLYTAPTNVSPSDNTAKSTGSTSENQQGQRAETVALRYEVDASGFCGDTGSSTPSCSRSGPTQDDKPTCLVESSSAESCQSSRKAIADTSLDSGSESTLIPGQCVPISISIVSANVTIKSTTLKEKDGVSIESSRESLQTGNTTTSLPVTT